MTRRGFLKFLGVGAAVVAVAPKLEVLLETVGPTPEFTTAVACDASVVSLTSMSSILKELYADKLNDLVYKDNPFLKMIPREEVWQGALVRLPIER